MSNGWNSELDDLPVPDSEDTNYVHTSQGNFTAQLLKQLASSLLRRIQIFALLAVDVLAGLNRLASKLSKRMKRGITIVTLVAATVLAGHAVSAQLVVPPPPSLRTVPVPEPDNLGEFVKDKVAAIALGKSLFWDMQVGSDGIQSCASCHFHAGADSRAKNQLNPGLLRVSANGTSNPDTVVNTGGLNYTLQPGDYPFHRLADPNNRLSTVLADSNDITSSQGTVNSEFVDVVPGSAQDTVTYPRDPVFNVGGTNVRRVQPRNTPTVINAVFNFRNFWDGRAQNEFNGVNPFGSRDRDAKVVKAVKNNKLEEVKISLKNSSLASQAVGPPLSDFEISATGRTFEEIGQKFRKGKKNKLPRELGKKLRFLRPLGKQIVHPDDSVLGRYSRAPESGLKPQTYEKMIEDAFKPEWWKSNQVIQVDADGKRTFMKNSTKGSFATNEYTLMEYNFPLFFGLAIQLYEATLISDNTPFDQFQEGNTSALTAQQQQGLGIFLGQDETQGGGRCINCHGGAEFSEASVSKVDKNRLKRRQGNLIDNGFNNIGVRPTFEDLGVGGVDPFGNPLSESRLAMQGRFNDPNLSPPLSSKDILAVDGAFKTPGLRNVELTAPYFHNGGQLTLRQVVDFYSRGGDFQPIKGREGEIKPLSTLNLSEDAKDAVVAFLKGLTDERVRYHRAPFDHPQLFVTNGHPGNQASVTNDGTGKATDTLLEIPAVGRKGLSNPLPDFPEFPPQ